MIIRPVIGTTCPYCGMGSDVATDQTGDGSMPSAGDYAVCWYCSGIDRYVECDGRLALVKVVLSELDDATLATLHSVQVRVAAERVARAREETK